MKKRITTTPATQGLRRSERIREQQSRLADVAPEEKQNRAEAPTEEQEQRNTNRQVDIEDIVVPMQTMQLTEAPNASIQQLTGEISYEVYCEAFGKDAKLTEEEFYQKCRENEYFIPFVLLKKEMREKDELSMQKDELAKLTLSLLNVEITENTTEKFERFYELRKQPKPVSAEMTKYHNITKYFLKSGDSRFSAGTREQISQSSHSRHHIEKDSIAVTALNMHAFSGTKYEAEINVWGEADNDIEAYVRDKCFSGSGEKLHDFVNKFTEMYDYVRACQILMKQCDVNPSNIVTDSSMKTDTPFISVPESEINFTQRVYLCVLQLLRTELTACLGSEYDSVAQSVQPCAKSSLGDLLECTLEEYPAAPGNNIDGQVKSLTLSGVSDIVAKFGNYRNVVHHEVKASFGRDAMKANRVRMQASTYANMYSLEKAQPGHVVKYVYSDIQCVGIAERYSRYSNDFGGVHFIAPRTTDVYCIILRLIYSLIENNEGLARKNCSRHHSSIHPIIAESDDEDAGDDDNGHGDNAKGDDDNTHDNANGDDDNAHDDNNAGHDHNTQYDNAGHDEYAGKGDNIAHWDVLTSWSDVSDRVILGYNWVHEAAVTEARAWAASVLGPLYLSEKTLMQRPKINMFDRWLTAPQDEHGAQKLLWDYHTVKPILILKAAVSSKQTADRCKSDDANIDKENANPNTNHQRNRSKC